MIQDIKNKYDRQEEISLKDLILSVVEYLAYLYSKWLYVLCFAICGALAGLGYAFTKKPQYLAITTFVLEENAGNGSGSLGSSLSGLASIAGVDLANGGGIFQGDNIFELYKSRRMVQKTLLTTITYEGRRQLLIDRYIEFNGIRRIWDANENLKGLQFNNSSSFSRLQDSVLSIIVADVTKNYLNVVKLDKKLSIIKAEVKSPDEFFSKAFNEEIVRNVNDFYIQTKTKKSLKNILILQQKTDSVRNIMNSAINTSVAVSDATPNLNPTRQIQRVAPVQRSQFSAEANKTVLTELIKNLELSKMSLLRETPLIQVIDEPVFPLNKIGSGKLKGLVIGGVLGGFICCLMLIARRLVKNVLNE